MMERCELGHLTILVNFKVEALNEYWIDAIDGSKYSVMLFGMQYNAFLTSSRNEMHAMERNVNARFLSRIGFIVEEIKDLQYQTQLEIEDRATEINNNEAECILTARSSLEASLADAGTVITSAAIELIKDLHILNEIAVHGVLDELELFVSRFDFKIFSTFGEMNTVTAMFTFLIMLESEIRNYGALFEYYVNEIYTELVIYDMLMEEVAGIVLPELDGGLQGFRNSAEIIRSSLVTCN